MNTRKGNFEPMLSKISWITISMFANAFLTGRQKQTLVSTQMPSQGVDLQVNLMRILVKCQCPKNLKPPGKNMLGNRGPYAVSKISPYTLLINDKGTRWPKLTSLRMGTHRHRVPPEGCAVLFWPKCVVWIWSRTRVSQPQSRDILHNKRLYNPSKGSKPEKTKKTEGLYWIKGRCRLDWILEKGGEFCWKDGIGTIGKI